MLRALFEKTGSAVYISHLDLMRVFQRAFKRAGLALTHSQGFNPRPTVSIALPLSLGTESVCELLDFELVGEKPSNDEICARLNAALIDGVRVRSVYDAGSKIKNLALLDCTLTLEYDSGVPEDAAAQIQALFAGDQVLMEKKSKTGKIQQQNLVEMIRSLTAASTEAGEVMLRARICCQNPTLNPMQISAAIETYLPHLRPDFVRCRREEIYDINETVFR